RHTGAKAAHLTQQEVRISDAVGQRTRGLRALTAFGGVQTAEAWSACIQITILGGIGEADQELAAEVQDVPPANQRDHVGRIVDELLVNKWRGIACTKARDIASRPEAWDQIRFG